jgi:diguanylate cyclase (GGDEF)-like protein
MQIPKPQLKKENTVPMIGQDWEMLLPSFADEKEQDELSKTRLALRKAQSIVREQQERINLLEKLSLTDELTGLTNRRGFYAAFDRELSLARRDARNQGILVMIDLDGFKDINDTWGHQTGDAYLCAVAQALHKNTRASDIVARLGGDEFGILMTHVDEHVGAKRLTELEQAFRKSEMTNQARAPHRLALRASFGFASYTGGDVADAVMESADLRLYAHKARSRDIIAVG